MSSSIDRRSLIKLTGASLLAAAFPALANSPRLAPPSKGKIPIAFLLSRDAVLIDFAGPWEVFRNVRDFIRGDAAEEVTPFELFTVAASTEPVLVSGGMRVIPNFSFDTAPQPKIVVIPAQSGAGYVDLDWIRKTSVQSDLVMSVCTGAFVLARTGLLDGKSATTHHSAFDIFAKQFPNIALERHVRFVDHGNLASSAGLTAGIDLAFHVVERYFGLTTAQKTAEIMEYQGRGWLAANSPDTHDHSHSDGDDKTKSDQVIGYICPPCGCAADGRVFEKPGACPACGMMLIKKT